MEHKMKVNILTGVRKGGPYTWGRDLAAELDRHGMEAKHIHTLGALLCSPIYQDADIVHTSLPLSYRLWRKPVIITVKGEYPSEKRIWKFLYLTAIKKADIITTPSYFLKERLNLERAIVIPNAVFTEGFKQVEHSERETVNLVTVTKFFFEDKARGVLDILQVLDTVPERIAKRLKYVVVGGGPYLDQVMRESKRYEVNVEFTDMLQNPGEVLESSDIFIYFSHHDNFPNVILEAMACGLPVVTNDVGAVSEIIENEKDGYIARTSEAYFKYLLSLVNSPDLRSKVGQSARRNVEAKFDWAKVVNSYVEIYKSVL